MGLWSHDQFRNHWDKREVKLSLGDPRGTGFPGSWEIGARNAGDSTASSPGRGQVSWCPECLRLINILRAAYELPVARSSGVLMEALTKGRKTWAVSSPLKVVHPVRKLRGQKHVVSAPEQGDFHPSVKFLHSWLNEKENEWMVYSLPAPNPNPTKTLQAQSIRIFSFNRHCQMSTQKSCFNSHYSTVNKAT